MVWEKVRYFPLENEPEKIHRIEQGVCQNRREQFVGFLIDENEDHSEAGQGQKAHETGRTGGDTTGGVSGGAGVGHLTRPEPRRIIASNEGRGPVCSDPIHRVSEVTA